MRRQTLAGLTALLGIFALAGNVSGRAPLGDHIFGPPGGPGGQHGRFLDAYADRVGLDEETREQIRQRYEASREQAEPIRAQLHDEHDALRQLLHEDDPDTEAVMARAELIGELETKMRKLRLATLLEVCAMLTVDQRAEMMAIHEERSQFRGRRHGGFGAPHPEELDAR